MAVCLEYQAVYKSRKGVSASLTFQLCAALLLLGALSARITFKIQTTKVGYQIAKERSRTLELDMQRRELELARSVLLRPDTLGKEAKRLGLRALDMGQMKRLTYP